VRWLPCPRIGRTYHGTGECRGRASVIPMPPPPGKSLRGCDGAGHSVGGAQVYASRHSWSKGGMRFRLVRALEAGLVCAFSVFFTQGSQCVGAGSPGLSHQVHHQGLLEACTPYPALGHTRKVSVSCPQCPFKCGWGSEYRPPQRTMPKVV
jgi:hypothetical protein